MNFAEIIRADEREASRLSETKRLARDVNLETAGGRTLFRALYVAETTKDMREQRAIIDLARLLEECDALTKIVPTFDVLLSARREEPKPRNGPPVNRIGVWDKHGRYRGHVGRKSSQATCHRLGVEDAKLIAGAWRGQ